MFQTTVTVTEPLFYSPFYVPTFSPGAGGWSTQYGGTASWTYALPPGALATHVEVKVPAKPRKKTSEWRKKRKNGKARNRWEKEIDKGRNEIISCMLNIFNGFQPLTILIADYTLALPKTGIKVANAKCASSKLPIISLQEVPRCHSWKRPDHSPITDEIILYCKGCRHFYCDKSCCQMDVSDYPVNPTTRIPLSSIGTIEECDLCDGPLPVD